MADPLAILHDLARRVGRLEEGRPADRRTTPPLSPRPIIRPTDPDSAAIIRYLQTSHTKTAEDRDVAAIRTWLTTRKQTR